jgi:hypothetical protein
MPWPKNLVSLPDKLPPLLTRLLHGFFVSQYDLEPRLTTRSHLFSLCICVLLCPVAIYIQIFNVNRMLRKGSHHAISNLPG